MQIYAIAAAFLVLFFIFLNTTETEIDDAFILKKERVAAINDAEFETKYIVLTENEAFEALPQSSRSFQAYSKIEAGQTCTLSVIGWGKLRYRTIIDADCYDR